MIKLTNCPDPECFAPASVSFTAEMQGVDFDGQLKLFRVERIACAAGHNYTRMADDEEEDA